MTQVSFLWPFEQTPWQLLHRRQWSIDQLSPSRLLTTGGSIGAAPLENSFGLFLVQCVIILSICRVLGLAGSFFKLPKVIFEIVGGILLGPSAIGRNSAYLETIFPKKSLPLLSVVANLGLVLYLFVVGMELDPKIIATHWRKAGGVAFVGMAVPFALGVAISQLMFDSLQASDPKYAKVPFVSFFVFIGTAMSITAFPVLARMLKESALIYTKAGAMSMGAAALNDAAAWCLLILAISIANAGDLSIAGLVFLSVVAFGTGLIVLIRPVFCRLVTYVEEQHSVALNNSLFCLTLIMVFLSAWTTELLGVHAIFGAFLFGLIMPRDSHLFKECNDKIEELVLTLTLPIYFALSGLQTDVTQINTTAQGAMVVLVCFIATIGKYIGAGGAAYFSGSTVRESIVVAFLMNTRGLVELIVLNLGVTAGVLSMRTFSVMVIMCLFTTFITGPTVQCVYPPHMREAENDQPDEDTQHLVPKDAVDIEKGLENRSPIEVGASMDVLAKDVRLTVLVDRIEHLQGMMEVISCFMPNTVSSALSVVAIKAHEPSLTDNDEFIGLNHEGRLIKLEAESTSYHENHARFVSANMGGKIEPQELLPLSMYLKAVGGKAQAYRMQGDPAEYPREIRTLSLRAGSTLMLFPWRPSQYVERLFWRTLKVFTAPIALVAHLNVALAQTLADEQAAATTTNRKRTNSEDDTYGTPARTRGMSIDASDTISPTLGSRGRSASQSIDVIKKSYTPARLHRTGSTIEMVRNHKVVEEDDDNDFSTSLLIRSVLGVITGASADTALFPMMLRFAQRNFVEVKVVVTSDRRTFPLPVREALLQFQRIANGYSNITIEHLITPSTDIPSLIELCSTNVDNNTMNGRSNGSCYDMIAIGYGSGIPDEEAVNATTRITTRGRSQTVSEAISAAVSNPTVPDSMELRRQLGLPETIASSTLPHPELGVLGCAIEEGGLANYLMVLHEPQGLINVARKTSKTSLPDVGISRSSSISGEISKSVIPPPPTIAINDSYAGDHRPKMSPSKKDAKKTIFSIPEIDMESLDLDIEDDGDDKDNELTVEIEEERQSEGMILPVSSSHIPSSNSADEEKETRPIGESLRSNHTNETIL